jgi:hypothetical protein
MRGLFLGLLLAIFLSPHRAEAQAIVLPCVPSGASCIPVSAANPLPTTGGGSIVIGTTTITGGATTQVLFNNAGVVSSDAGLTKVAGATGAVTVGGILTTPAGTACTTGTQGLVIGTDTYGFFTKTSPNASLGICVGGLLKGDFGIGANAQWTFQGLVNTGSSIVVGANVAATGKVSATLASATGTNAVCNTPGTTTDLTVQVWATGCAASSARFKEDIAAIDREKAFETILALQPVSYFYKPEFNMGADKHIGFTAEQVATVDPFLATFEDDGVTPHAVKYNEMAPLFAAAIQKLQAEIEALKAAK